MKNTCDSPFIHLMNAAGYRNLGAAKRAHRQLQRQWAVEGRRQYGIKSIVGYAYYMGYENV